MTELVSSNTRCETSMDGVICFLPGSTPEYEGAERKETPADSKNIAHGCYCKNVEEKQPLVSIADFKPNSRLEMLALCQKVAD